MDQVETTVYGLLSSRQRINATTDLIQFTKYVKQTLPEVSEKDVLRVFKGFEAEGYGAVIQGRHGNRTRFKWGYNLKEAAQKALGLTKQVSSLETKGPAIKRKAGRPKGSKNKVKAQGKVKLMKPAELKAMSPVITINLTLPRDSRPQDIQALVELAKGLNQK